MLDTLLSKLTEIRDFLTNPAIPDDLDKVAEYVHEAADLIRNAQGGTVLMGAERDQFAKCEALVKEISKCHETRNNTLVGLPKATATQVVGALDPASIMMIIQVVQSLFALIKQLRGGTTTT